MPRQTKKDVDDEALKVKFKSIQKVKNDKKARRQAFVRQGDESDAMAARRRAFLREDKQGAAAKQRRDAFLREDKEDAARRKRRDAFLKKEENDMKARRKAFLKEVAVAEKEDQAALRRRDAFLKRGDIKARAAGRRRANVGKPGAGGADRRAADRRADLQSKSFTKAKLYSMAQAIAKKKDIQFKKGKGLSTFTKEALAQFIFKNE